MAQSLLDESLLIGGKRLATRNGLAFVAQLTHPAGTVWHGYPEAWEKIPTAVRNNWLREGRIRRRDLRQWGTREQVDRAWMEANDAE